MKDKPDFKVFSSLCYALQNEKRIKITKIADDVYPLNYFRADVELKSGEKICILQNVDIGVIAFATPQDEDSFAFLDNIHLQRDIHNILPSAEILSATLLNKQVEDKDVKDLLENNTKILDELMDESVKFWLPCRVGDVLFSWFFD